ncbi:phosphopantothenoylcysteine decarboxylase/phosphopantothenate--cysteine ligase [Roseivirga ehrenbergii]|uniref:Coenzyme A biosynthesis bifunctional protein CoaBC n=1 Tax=Roseivirga ehrenbergii (strain DSM 102268 / JCM 13514 / KCTC 12282 / NCIMB 14502 / KMM 6017) TaxID=279360 RepID=A0A150X8N7_ROSEK|nr:bifunctional phosphopantothenoylcysteine decarboxylase/phosphopantothenate--cysteine ligase CoaBC [Roseivirga ehrenbergii]KYG75044.1 phosphopantothenoylcysteine decarboxylase [Roseivirga ehrenbergii]TCL13597.1 phosphopantothenoylcysteine decarboxylase/phosphopantothenate--cysteine ligase [Roseivirga ehrenbergii]
MLLKGKKIILGVSGSIAAYKAAIFVRLLVKEEAEVKVIMTKAATDFITPLTLATLSKNPVLIDFQKDKTGEWNNHVDLGLWADAIIMAPASANTIGKMANGLCDNLLLATYLSARCPVFFAPAMDLDMYQHPSVLANIQKLISFGNHLIEAEHGELASGLIGQGRMAEPENLVTFLSDFFSKKSALKGKKLMITAGPTYEAIDPVRFIGNHSTGKMGYALAEEAANQGAEVTLISGPTHLTIEHANVKLIRVKSGNQMYEACSMANEASDINIMAAAVADYTPKTVADQKIKKKGSEMTVELVKTTDIAKSLGAIKKENQLNIGFALETEAEIEHAQQKIKSKNFDLIVLNSLNDKGAGFGHDTNKVTIIDNQNNIQHFELKSKREVAKDIINAIVQKLEA